MKFLEFYTEKLNLNNDSKIFEYFINNLKPTIKDFDFFVNWHKVLDNYNNFEYELNLLGTIIGENNIVDSLRQLLEKYPSVKRAIPILLACRMSDINIMTQFEGKFTYKNFIFADRPVDLWGEPDEQADIDDCILFLTKTGILDLFKNKKIKSLPDYVLGIKVGLDSNARKNRIGTKMEHIIEYYIKNICNDYGYEYIIQATKDAIKQKWNLNITLDKSDRKIDFALYNGKKLFLIECNFYEGGGSKLKSTAREYKNDFQIWQNDGHEFIWITDGDGWNKTRKALLETYNSTNYILNLAMLEQGILQYIFGKNK